MLRGGEQEGWVHGLKDWRNFTENDIELEKVVSIYPHLCMHFFWKPLAQLGEGETKIFNTGNAHKQVLRRWASWCPEHTNLLRWRTSFEFEHITIFGPPPSSHISYLSPLIGREEEAWIEYIRKLPTTRFQPCLIEIHQIMCIFFPPPLKTPPIL